MGRSKTVPDRWLDYNDVGGIVPGTRFIAFKVPLRESICSRLPPNRRFTPDLLLQRIYGLGLVIDLTCTDRYYDPVALVSRGVNHAKIMCAGQQIPSADVVNDFFRAVDAFVMDPANDGKLIGVHCTHGVNRTGYLVCKYMIEKLSIAPTTAIEEFQNARGHRFDRDEYVSDLQRVDRPEYPSEFRRFDGQYVSNFQGADGQGHVRDFRGVGSSSSEPFVAAARAPTAYDGYGNYSFNAEPASGVHANEQSGWRYGAPSGESVPSYGYFDGMPPQQSGLGIRLPAPMGPHFRQANGSGVVDSGEQYSIRVPYRPHTDGGTGYWRH
ncbi:hypothetical protein V5799_004204 [Amblyomma americanum]|uniref:Tyrosine specific protein phosphatases domain-containing protein n=1 Tax=Amblyomma americanum TaxID=6943 RepID=A0AAQ4D6S4_AMBAM